MGSVSSNLLDVETSGARITLRMVAHTRLTARQKFSWCATGINLKFTTWMTRNEKYNKNQKKTSKREGMRKRVRLESNVFTPCGSPIKLMNFHSFGQILSYPKRLETFLGRARSVTLSNEGAGAGLREGPFDFSQCLS